MKLVDIRRAAALEAMELAADEYHAPERSWEEVDKGDHVIFVGRTDDGRQFWQGYAKETERERLDDR